jgi:hypothetical protein
LLGAEATRHVLYLLEGQYLYGQQTEDGSLRYKFVSAASVRLAFSQEPVDSGWLPPEVRRWGYTPSGQWAVMFVPPARHRLWLVSEIVLPPPQPGEEDGPPSGEQASVPRQSETGPLALEVALPGLVFAGVGQHYYLWAVKEVEFLPEGWAYHAPLPNVYPDGRICWGSNRVEPVTPQTLRAAWQLFISSPFNQHLAGGKSRRYPENILAGLERLAASSPKTRRRAYPLRDLQPLTTGWQREGASVGGLVERLIGSR